MIELQQFLMWIVRKMAKWPMRCYNLLLDTFQYGDWYIPIIGISLMIGAGGVLFGLIVALCTGGPGSGAVILIVWGLGFGTIISAGVQTMYRAFKREQQELFDTLKGNNDEDFDI
mgnify:CR=1 FL=1